MREEIESHPNQFEVLGTGDEESEVAGTWVFPEVPECTSVKRVRAPRFKKVQKKQWVHRTF